MNWKEKTCSDIGIIAVLLAIGFIVAAFVVFSGSYIPIAIFLVLVGIGIYFLLHPRDKHKYDDIFAAEHIVEFSDLCLKAAKTACGIKDVDLEEYPHFEDLCCDTSAKMSFLYTVGVNEENGNYAHHFSVSISGKYTPAAIGKGFSLFTLRLLSISPDDVQFKVSQKTIHHCMFELSAADQIAFENQETKELSKEEAGRLFFESLSLRGNYEWAPLTFRGERI